jgi:hypothetical protein
MNWNSEVQNAWSCNSTHPIRIDGAVVVKASDNFTLPGAPRSYSVNKLHAKDRKINAPIQRIAVKGGGKTKGSVRSIRSIGTVSWISIT